MISIIVVVVLLLFGPEADDGYFRFEFHWLKLEK